MSTNGGGGGGGGEGEGTGGESSASAAGALLLLPPFLAVSVDPVSESAASAGALPPFSCCSAFFFSFLDSLALALGGALLPAPSALP